MSLTFIDSIKLLLKMADVLVQPHFGVTYFTMALGTENKKFEPKIGQDSMT